MKFFITMGIIFVLGLGALIWGLASIEQCFEKGYAISVFGEDKYAGTDYAKALEMANGKPIYESYKLIPCE